MEMPAFQRTSRDAARHESGFLRSIDEVKDGERFVSCRKTDELSGAKKFGKFQELEGKPEHFPGAGMLGGTTPSPHPIRKGQIVG